MKTTKRTFKMTALSLLICFCMVFGLTACGGFTQDDIDKAVNDATTPLNEQITALEADIAEKTAKITTLESEKAALVTEKGELEADITSLEAEKAALEDDKAELEDEVETLEAEKKALTDENTELEASITSKNAEIATLTSSVSSLEAEKTTLNGRVSELNAQITTLNERIADLEAGGETDGAEITELKAKVSTLEGEKTTLTARVTELEGTIEDKNAEITDLEDDVATLTTDKAALEGQITSLNGTITAKNNDIANLNSSISALETEKANLEEQVTTLNASISAKETEIANLNSSIATLTAEKQALTDRVTALENENAALKNCVKGNHVAGSYSKTETTHTYTCTVCGTEITEEHEYIERACVCGAEIEESNVTDMKNTLYKGNTYTLQNNLTLSENASVAATGKAPVLNLNGNTILTNNHSFKWLGGDLTINGNGSFVGNYAKGGILDVQGTNAALRLVGDVTLTNTAEDGYHITWHSSVLDLSGYTGNALMIKNISSFAQETFTIILPDGWKLYHGDGTAFAESETIAANEIVTADLDVDAKWGTSVDDLTNGGSLAEALASNAVYIQLRQNVTLTDRIEVAEGVTLTFDFNGYTVTAGSNKDVFYNNGTLTLLNGKILDNNASYCSVTNKGTLTMTDIVINGGNPLKQTQGTATLTRCALTQTVISFYDCAMYAEGGTISATDSSFSADRYAIGVCNTDLTLKGTISLACGDTAYSNDIFIENGDLDLSLVTSSLNDVSVYIEGTTNAPATVTLLAGYEAKDASSGDTVDLSNAITGEMSLLVKKTENN